MTPLWTLLSRAATCLWAVIVLIGCSSVPPDATSMPVTVTPTPVQPVPGAVPARYLYDEQTTSNELLALMTNAMLAEAAAAHRRYQFSADWDVPALEDLALSIRSDFLTWLGARPHVSTVRNLETTELIAEGDFRLIYVVFENANGLTVRARMAIPRMGTAPYPVILFTRSAGSGLLTAFTAEEQAAPYNAMPLYFVERGYIVFALDVPLYDRNNIFYMGNAAGENWLFYQSCDKVSSAMDYLASVPEADLRRIALYGISSGGWASIMAGVCEARIPVVVASGVNVFSSHDVMISELRPFVHPYFYGYNVANRPDLHQAMYSFAPRYSVIELNQQDQSGSFPLSLANAQTVLDYYAARGMPERARLVEINDSSCRHCMYPALMEPVIDGIFDTILAEAGE